MRLDHLREGRDFVHAHAVFGPLIAAHADFENEILSHAPRERLERRAMGNFARFSSDAAVFVDAACWFWRKGIGAAASRGRNESSRRRIRPPIMNWAQAANSSKTVSIMA